MNQIKIDNYTKGVLTVIAICLLILTINQLNLFPEAYAGEYTRNSIIPGANYGLVPLNYDGSISVTLSSYNEIDVNIVGVDTSDELDVNITGVDTSDELDINIDEIGGAYVSHGQPIPVKIR